jgi:hypothetical protein
LALIKYPNDSRHCFCPSVIRDHHRSTTKVRFYDCYEVDLENNQYIIPINKNQFERYVKNRIEKEKSLRHCVTVGLNNETNTFMLGTIQDRVGNGHEYIIEWCNSRKNEQKDEHLFGAFKRHVQHNENDYVLAIDDNDKLYKPARIKSISNDRRSLRVQFTNLNQTNSPPR